MQDAIGVRDRLTWDGAGNLVAQAGSGAERASYAYDTLGRLVGITRPGTSSVLYRRDGVGNVTMVERGDGSPRRPRPRRGGKRH